MEITVYNPQKGRMETINVEYTKQNTTWFEEYNDNSDIMMITDVKGGLLIKDFDYSYPIFIYDISRSEINHSQKKAKEIKRFYEMEYA